MAVSAIPFKSDKQRAYLYANHPEIAKRWSNEMKEMHKMPDGHMMSGKMHKSTSPRKLSKKAQQHAAKLLLKRKGNGTK